MSEPRYDHGFSNDIFMGQYREFDLWYDTQLQWIAVKEKHHWPLAVHWMHQYEQPIQQYAKTRALLLGFTLEKI
jgi:hypothetical protein